MKKATPLLKTASWRMVHSRINNLSMTQHIAFFQLILRMWAYEADYINGYPFMRPHFRESRDVHDIYIAYCRRHGFNHKDTPDDHISSLTNG